jgi:hypothetical protein
MVDLNQQIYDVTIMVILLWIATELKDIAKAIREKT